MCASSPVLVFRSARRAPSRDFRMMSRMFRLIAMRDLDLGPAAASFRPPCGSAPSAASWKACRAPAPTFSPASISSASTIASSMPMQAPEARCGVVAWIGVADQDHASVRPRARQEQRFQRPVDDAGALARAKSLNGLDDRRGKRCDQRAQHLREAGRIDEIVRRPIFGDEHIHFFTRDRIDAGFHLRAQPHHRPVDLRHARQHGAPDRLARVLGRRRIRERSPRAFATSVRRRRSRDRRLLPNRRSDSTRTPSAVSSIVLKVAAELHLRPRGAGRVGEDRRQHRPHDRPAARHFRPCETRSDQARDFLAAAREHFEPVRGNAALQEFVEDAERSKARSVAPPRVMPAP